MSIEPWPLINLWFQVQYSTFWANLACATLNFCSCTTWFLDLDDLVEINKAWLYKEPNISVLQANVQKEECWTCKRSRVQCSLGETCFTGFFLFSHSKASDAYVGSFKKPLLLLFRSHKISLHFLSLELNDIMPFGNLCFSFDKITCRDKNVSGCFSPT